MGIIIRALFLIYLFSVLLSRTVAIKGDDDEMNNDKKSRKKSRRAMNNIILHMDDHDIDYTKQDEAVRNLVDWFIEQGGYIHPNVEIRRWDPDDPISYFGAHINGPVEKDELLMKVPGSVKIQLDASYRTDKYTYVESVCELAWMLQREYELGKDSKYAPYIAYIKSQSKHQIPAMWSDVGKYLIKKVQGDLSMMDFEADDAEGAHMHNWLEDYFGGKECLEDASEDEELEPWFVAMTTQRGFDSSLIPVYDMINHHNGFVNSITRPSIYDEDGFGVYALQDLDVGDEVLYSYHDCPDCKVCPDCETSLDYWGTPEMLRDFGFVEPYPQRFYYQDMGPVYLEIKQEEGGYRIKNVGGKWPDIHWVESQIERLGTIFDDDIYPLRNSMPLHELETIANYHESLLHLFTAYYEAHMAEIVDKNEDESDDSESEDEDEDENKSFDEECPYMDKEEMSEEQQVESEEEDIDDFSTEL